MHRHHYVMQVCLPSFFRCLQSCKRQYWQQILCCSLETKKSSPRLLRVASLVGKYLNTSSFPYYVQYVITPSKYTIIFTEFDVYVMHRELVISLMMTSSDLCSSCKVWEDHKHSVEVLFEEFHIQVYIKATIILLYYV